MAMGKNKTGIMAAITAAAEAGQATPEARDRAQRTLPRGTIGSVRAGLGGIQEIDTSTILAWGPQDRLGVELTAVNSGDIEDLAISIQKSGQQVPVLLRPSSEKDGHFEVIYGRRRILACRELGKPVKALIRTLDDSEALMAKGLENASRQDLSYYERARFAQAILGQGYSRGDVCEALAISKNTLSQLERITRTVPDAVGDGIGAAPGSGRPKWMTLAAAFEGDRLDEARAVAVIVDCPDECTSDERLEAVIKAASSREVEKPAATERRLFDGVNIKTSRTSVNISVAKTGKMKGFAEWLDEQLDDLIKESFERFQAESSEGKRS